MSETVTTAQPIRTIRLGTQAIDEILERQDHRDPLRQGESDQREYRYHSHSFRFRLQPASAAAFTEYVGVSRKLSPAGVTVLIGLFVHRETPCEVQLVSARGTWETVPGMVKNCTHVTGSVHEIYIEFKRNIDLTPFCAESIQRKVLLVEDSSLLTRLTTQLLAEANCKVLHAANGEDAVISATQGVFDIVMMDIELPGIDGLEATRRIRKTGYNGVIIAATSRTSPDEIAECMAAGCDGHIAKPYQKDALLKLLASCQPERILSSMSGNAALRPLIREFVELSQSYVQRMREAMESKDLQELESIIRMIRSEGGALGFEPVAQAANLAERMLDEKTPEASLIEAVDQLIGVCSLIRSSDSCNAADV